MKNNTIKFSADMTIAYVSKSFLKQSLIYGTNEYKLLKELRNDHPNVIVKTNEIKKNPDKVSYKNLTYTNIETYIKSLPDSELLMNEYNLTKKRSCIAKNPYRYTLNWFKSACFESDAEFKLFRNKIELNPLEVETSENKSIYIPATTNSNNLYA